MWTMSDVCHRGNYSLMDVILYVKQNFDLDTGNADGLSDGEQEGQTTTGTAGLAS